MPASWRQTFEDLRKRFAAGAERHPELRFAMAQTTCLEGNGEYLLNRARAFELGNRPHSWTAGWRRVTPGKYERIDESRERILEPSKAWHIQFCGDGEGSHLFMQIAEDAGWCLPTSAHPAIHALPKGFREGGAIGAFRWLFLLFH